MRRLSFLLLLLARPAYAANSITISRPTRYQTFQRNGSDQADISVAGRFSGTPRAIEARFGAGPWTPIVAKPRGGVYSGTLRHQPSGQGTLSVRFSNATGVTASVRRVGIGDIFAVAGQSNADGIGAPTTFTPSRGIVATLYTVAGTWSTLADPTGYGGQGSVWPAVGQLMVTNVGVPIGFVPCAESGSFLVPFFDNPNWTPGGSLYMRMTSRIRAVGGVKAVLWWQGESDAAASCATGDCTYQRAEAALASRIRDDFGVPMIGAQIGEVNGQPLFSGTGPGLNVVRLAQQANWNNGTVLVGPILYDVPLPEDGVHFTSLAEKTIAAERWWAAIQRDLYGGHDGRGPRLSSASRRGNMVVVTFVDESLPLIGSALSPGAWSLTSNGRTVGVGTASITGPDQVTLVAADALVDPVTVSFAAEHSGTGATVPTDSSAVHLPAEVVVGAAVADQSTSTPGARRLHAASP